MRVFGYSKEVRPVPKEKKRAAGRPRADSTFSIFLTPETPGSSRESAGFSKCSRSQVLGTLERAISFAGKAREGGDTMESIVD
jgi:hypothetical protein